MPPPDVPSWLYPSVALNTRHPVGEEATHHLWVEAIDCRGSIGVYFRSLRWENEGPGWTTGRDIIRLRLEEFLELVIPPEPDRPPTYRPDVYIPVRIPVQETDPAAGPVPTFPVPPIEQPDLIVPEPSAEFLPPNYIPDILQTARLAIYLTLGESRTAQRASLNEQTIQVLNRLAKSLNLSPAPEDAGEALSAVLNRLDKLLPPDEETGEAVPRTRFERDPLV